VRVTTLCKRLLDLDGISVTKVDFAGGVLVADVALRRRLLACPRCEFTTRARYDTRPVKSLWRGLDLGRRKVSVRAGLRRPALGRARST
jgi:transposase